MDKTSQTPFNWSINEDRLWPPSGRPKPPFGPTAIEVMRSCPLRISFECSKAYERRMASAARVGIAFHRTLQSLTEHPISSSLRSEIIHEASQRFRRELAQQETQKNARPREQMLSYNEERVQRAQESIAVEALRLAVLFAGKKIVPGLDHQHSVPASNNQPTKGEHHPEEFFWVEIPVQSRDGLLAGRVDYAERLPGGGVRLLDYKSALRDDLPERYERQLQLYALLWLETFGEWPVEALVVYPFTGAAYQVAIDPTVCERVGDEARLIAKKFEEGLGAKDLATPGTVCAVCEFRPWCRPFWQWQTSHTNHTLALNQAFYGFEGTILSLELKEHHWKVIVQWHDAEVRIVAPYERFPQLHNAHPGMRIRALDMRLYGLRYRPQARISENSEIFLVEV